MVGKLLVTGATTDKQTKKAEKAKQNKTTTKITAKTNKREKFQFQIHRQ